MQALRRDQIGDGCRPGEHKSVPISLYSCYDDIMWIGIVGEYVHIRGEGAGKCVLLKKLTTQRQPNFPAGREGSEGAQQ